MAVSAWVGKRVPDAKAKGLREILKVTFELEGLGPPRKVSAKYWVKGPPPKKFVPIDDIPPTSQELRKKDYGYGITWSKIPSWEWMVKRVEE